MTHTTSTLIAIDTETHLIGAENVAPKLVCVSFAQEIKGEMQTALHSHIDPELETFLDYYLTHDEFVIVGQNIAYDMGVLANYFPNLIVPILRAYDAGRIHCTRIREKELTLARTGDLKYEFSDQAGKMQPRKYSLAELAMRYLNEDLSDSKDMEDSWRLNYSMLDGKTIDEYPEEAKTYAMRDAALTLRVYLAQDAAAALVNGFAVHHWRAAVDFALFLTTCYGIAIDPEAKAEIQAMLEIELAPEKTALLLKSGILREKKPWINTKLLGAKVKEVCEANGIEVSQTAGRVDKATGERIPGICTDADVMDAIAHLDPILAEYQHRQSLQKLVSTELPRIDAPIVHPSFDVFKETGRTSSSASDLFPSCNIQNVDPRVRPCYVPRPGYLFLSVDYSSIELVTLAQKIYSLFGHSTLRDLINAGKNPHDYLGAQMAYAFDERFRKACDDAGVSSREEIHEVFVELKTSDDEGAREFYKKYRTFAKPTGLGYPGGLGAETFITYAKGTYDVVVTLEQAVQFKNIWLDTFPEMKEYFKWITWHCKDPNHPEAFAYVSPLGMLRSNCAFCAAANGAGMQTPTAEGALIAFYEVVRACYDYTDETSSLFGCRPQAFIHDEILLMVPDDVEKVQKIIAEASKIMVDCMRQITPDVDVAVEAKTMRRWYKEAEPVFDPQGRLIPWVPKPKEIHT